MTKTVSHTLTISLVLLLAFAATASAQKKKQVKKPAAKTIVKPVEPEVDYSEYPICKVMILDSTVVKKSQLIKSLQLPVSLGRIFVDDNTGENAYENGFGDQRIITKKDAEGKHSLYRLTQLGNTWSDPEPINISGTFPDIFNPFMSADGQTLYFASSPLNDESEKRISLWMTTYDTETRSFLTPQLLPYPFTTSGDNLYYIEDDTDSLAWFVTTRNQQEGDVCIYTMRIHEPWQYYNPEEKTPAQMKSLALIDRISDTWPSTQEYSIEMKNLTSVRKEIAQSATYADDKIYFVGTHDKLFTKLSDFTSNESRIKYKQLVALIDDIKTQERQLEEFRRVYHNSMDDSKDGITKIIKESEQKLLADKTKAEQLTNDIRKIEK